MKPLHLLPMAVVAVIAAVLLPAVPASAAPWVPKLPGTTASTDPEHYNSHYCDGCEPPLRYGGGRIADTSGPAGLTIRPIYWIPAGTKPFNDGYIELTSRYITDVAAASGATDNVFSITPQYYQGKSGAKTFLKNKYTAETPIIDTQPFPEGDCNPSKKYTTCLTDDQLREELTRLRTTLGLPTGMNHFYPVFLPPDLQTQDRDKSYSAEAYCGYHRSFGADASPMLYGNETYLEDGCGIGQSPNRNVPADGAISVFSHELAEMLTDPIEDEDAWRDASGSEIGDICGDDYGKPLGSADANDPDGTKYNQVINGDKYYTQTEFSNTAFRHQGFGYGCQQRSDAVTPPSPPAGNLSLQAVTPALPADGKARTDVYATVSDQKGGSLANDPVQFNTYVWAGVGDCGTVSGGDAKTDADGTADVTYTASKGNVVCAVVIKDALAGKSTSVLVYQGKYRGLAPKGTDSFPTRVVADGRPRTFTATFRNRSDTAIDHAALSLDLFPGRSGRTLKTAGVKLSYSLTGRHGRFRPLKLSGSRRIGKEPISLPVGSRSGQTIGAHKSLKVHYRLTIPARAYRGRTAADVFHVGSFLDQVNVAAGTSATVAETLTTYVKVAPRR